MVHHLGVCIDAAAPLIHFAMSRTKIKRIPAVRQPLIAVIVLIVAVGIASSPFIPFVVVGKNKNTLEVEFAI